MCQAYENEARFVGWLEDQLRKKANGHPCVCTHSHWDHWPLTERCKKCGCVEFKRSNGAPK